MKLKKTMTLIASMALVASACGGQSSNGGDAAPAPAPAPAESQPEGPPFFETRSIEVTIPFGAGGGTDSIIRFLAPFIRQYTPGNPTVQVFNVPGGGSITGANGFVLTEAPDGTKILGTATSTLMPWLLGQDIVRYDLRELQPLIGFPTNRIVYVSPQAGITDAMRLADPRDRPLRFGGVGPTGSDVVMVLALNALRLTDTVEFIFGYSGGGAAYLAFQQGELDGNEEPTVSYFSGPQELEASGEVIPLFTFGLPDGSGGFLRDPFFPDLPTVEEVYRGIHGSAPSGPAWDAFSTFMGISAQFAFGFWTHGDAPTEAVEALRDSLQRLSVDATFRLQGEAIFGPYEPVVGAALNPIIEAIAGIDPDVLEYVRNFLIDEYEADL